MPGAPLLTDDQIADGLAGLLGWERDEERLVKVFHFDDFTQAVAFVARLVEPSNAQDHHPDVAIHWNQVTLALWTHASGGITQRDLHLAATIDAMTEDA